MEGEREGKNREEEVRERGKGGRRGSMVRREGKD